MLVCAMTFMMLVEREMFTRNSLMMSSHVSLYQLEFDFLKKFHNVKPATFNSAALQNLVMQRKIRETHAWMLL